MTQNDRNHPLRAFLDGVAAFVRVPKRSDIQAIELTEDVTDSERRDFVAGVADYCRQIVKALQNGDNAGARELIGEAVDEYGDYVDVQAMAEKQDSPRDLASRVPRGVA